MRRFKDVRKEFERSSECLERAQERNAQAPRGKVHEVEEASNALLNARRAFRAEALDYVLEVRMNAGWSKNHTKSQMSHICITHAWKLVWHVRIDLAQLPCCCCWWWWCWLGRV